MDNKTFMVQGPFDYNRGSSSMVRSIAASALTVAAMVTILSMAFFYKPVHRMDPLKDFCANNPSWVMHERICP